MALFKPIWKKDDAYGHKNNDKAMTYVAKTTDQKILKRITAEAICFNVAFAAAEKLTDKRSIADLLIWGPMTYTKDEPNVKRLLEMLDDTESLTKVAVSYDHTRRMTPVSYLRPEDILDRISDEESIICIAKTAVSRKMRTAAVNRINAVAGQDDILFIAKNDPDIDVRRAAIDRITDDFARSRLDSALAPLEITRDKEIAYQRERHAMQQEYEKRVQQQKKGTREGCCPHCGVRLTTPAGGIPKGAAVYCSACHHRIS